jgi:hypothetical protein
LVGRVSHIIILADSVTDLTDTARDRTVVSGSHGGRFPAAVAARLGVRGAVLNDAGIGRDEAGVAGLLLFDAMSVPAAAVSHLTAEIGDAHAVLERGRISVANQSASHLGVCAGMPAAEAAGLIDAAGVVPVGEPPNVEESRHLLRDGSVRVWALDSASLVRDDDHGDIVLTGSHGALVGGRAERALRADVRGAIFNDAGSPDRVSAGRLPVLEQRRIPAATVAASSARIGDGRSTYHDGVLSAANEIARACGAHPGMTARGFVELLLDSDAEPEGDA